MTSRRIDQLLSFVGAVLIVLSSYQLFFSRSGSYEGSPLGHLSALEKVVKLKRARALDWVDANPLDLITENQMIYTDELSEAEVQFTEGQKLLIGENSLVKIRSRGRENELDVGQGTIRATLAGNEPFVVKLNGEDYELRGQGAAVEINLRGDVGEIGVVSGEAELARDGKVTTLNEKTAVVVEKDNFSTRVLAYKNLRPHQALLFGAAGSARHPVTFTWEGGDDEAQLHLGQRPDLSDARTMSVSGSSHELILEEGDYFWKLSGKSGESLTRTFRLRAERPPEILRPRSGDKVEVYQDETGQGLVRLDWSSPEAADFLVEINGVTQSTQKETLTVPVEEQELRWRVRVNDPQRTQSLWSPLQTVAVTLHPFPKLPVNLHPDGVEYQSFTGAPEKVELSWSSNLPVELELESPEERTTQRIPENVFVIDGRHPGKYRWRLRARDEAGRTSAWTPWKDFEIKDLSREKSSEGIQRVQLQRPDQEVTFGWEGKGSNVFELSRDRAFTEIIVTREVTGSETRIVVPNTGTYYWRSREFRADGTLHVSEPRKVIIEPVPAPVKPEALPPMEIPLEHETPKATVIDWLFSSAYADDVLGIARITLPPKENVKSYVLRIYRKGEERPLLEERVSGTTFLWKNALPGEYDFQYAVVDHFDRQSPFSDRSSLSVKELGPDRPLLISPIRLEKVTGPKVVLRWGFAARARTYEVAVYRDEELKDKILDETVSDPEFIVKPNLESGTYFWRIHARDAQGEKTPSSVGRFIYEAPPEEIRAIPTPAADWWKGRRDRAQLAWSPSMDTYDFSDGDKNGKISGNALMGMEGKGTLFREKWVFSGEFFRQSGKVYKEETYTFMKLTLDAGWILLSGNSLLAMGPMVGMGTGQTYEIKGTTVSASGVSSPMYGLGVRGLHDFSPAWSLEGKLSYLLGEVKEIEASSNVLRRFSSFFVLGGGGIVSREYNKSSGKQSSLKLSVGLGREF